MEGAWPFSSSPAGFSPVPDFSPLLGPCASCPFPDPPSWLPEGWTRNCPCVSHTGRGRRERKEGTVSGALPCGCLRARLPPKWLRWRPSSSGQGGRSRWSQRSPAACCLPHYTLLCSDTPGPPWSSPHVPAARAGDHWQCHYGSCAEGGGTQPQAGLPPHTAPALPHVVWSLLSPG